MNACCAVVCYRAGSREVYVSLSLLCQYVNVGVHEELLEGLPLSICQLTQIQDVRLQSKAATAYEGVRLTGVSWLAVFCSLISFLCSGWTTGGLATLFGARCAFQHDHQRGELSCSGVCVCIYIYTCMYVFACVCICVCMYVFVYIHMHVCM